MKKLLVVDDDRGNRLVVVDVLMAEWPQAEILTAPNGRIGLEVALAEKPEIILLDWEMPEMDGIEMLKALRQNPEMMEVPVVMYTGVRTDAVDLRQALEAGADEFLRKPVDHIELVARVRSICLQRQYFAEKKKAELAAHQCLLDANERELWLRKNELTSLALILEQRDLFVKSLVKELEEVSGSHSEESLRKKLHSVSRKIRQELKSEKNWEAIKVRMNSIHSEFLARLVEKHPDLTPNELKLCSLMKLNLSRKEVADILHISLAGVEKRRYRLRKKLGLAASEKMENYIHVLTGPATVA